MERPNHQVLPSILGLILGLPASVVPALSLCFLGSRTPNLPIPAKPVVREQFLAPGCTKLLPSCPSGLWPLSTPHPYSQGLRRPVWAREAPTLACFLPVSLQFSSCKPLQGWRPPSPQSMRTDERMKRRQLGPMEGQALK